MKHVNKCKRKGKSVLPALGEKNFAKRVEENDKKLDWSLDRVVWREKKLKTFWKNEFEHVKNSFLKTLYTIFDWSKIRFNRSSINRASIETNRGWSKFLIAILIDWKIGSIDRNSRNFFFFWKIKAILCRNSSKHWIWWK